MRVAFDIGGTFTDVIALSDDNKLVTAKVLSLLDRVGEDVVACVRQLSAAAKVDSFIHGTTICSNAVIENKVAPTGLIATRGFRDALELRDQKGPATPSVGWANLPPLVPRQLRLEVDERILADGSVDVPLDTASAIGVIGKLLANDLEAIAVCLINSYLNPVHEKQLARLLGERAPGLVISLSSEINPEMGEYSRSSTTVINAALTPIVNRYLDGLERYLSPYSSNLLIMQSNGGIMTSQAARRRPMYMVESGPAAGVLAAAKFASEVGVENVISFDMGGTTAKACLIRNGVPLEKSKVSIGSDSTAAGRSVGAGHVLRVPSIDLVEVGAGGGSIAWVEGGILRVGPHSAGADPGPVCYGRGGHEPTVTDANVVLGNINPHSLGGGKLKIDREAAWESIARLGDRLNMDVLPLAHGITQVANAVMMRALRAVSTERGYDPREFALMAFGGAGPIHAAALAETIGISKVVVPSFPGLFSALGLLLADYRFDYVHSVAKALDALEPGEIPHRYDEMERAARDEMKRVGMPVEKLRFERRIDMRYSHQFEDLTLPFFSDSDLAKDLRPALAEHFLHAHKLEFGFDGRGDISIVNLRLRAIAPAHQIQFSELASLSTSESDHHEDGVTRDVYFGHQHGLITVPVRSRAMIEEERPGPMVIEEPDTTVVVSPGWSVRRDSYGNLILTR